MTKRGLGRIGCLALMAATAENGAPSSDSRRAARRVVALDGCERDCASTILRRAGLTDIAHVRLTDLGLVKGSSPPTYERITLALETAATLLPRAEEIGEE